jgi:FkbM family methyltransferase
MEKNNEKIFIDCGANMGQSVDNFIEKWTDCKDYTILSYEANPRLASYFDRFANLKNFKFKQEAIWIYDGVIDFYLCNSGNASSSIIGTKLTGNLDKHPTTVKCVDIDRIIRQYSKEDSVLLKIDIEGAEYELLEYMLAKNTFELVDRLYIEFHNGKVHKTKEDDKYLLDKLNEYPNLQVFHDTYNHFNFI